MPLVFNRHVYHPRINVLDVHDENECVVLLDLLHGRLSVQWIEENGGGIEARFVLFQFQSASADTLRKECTYVDCFAGVLGRPRQNKSLWSTESGRESCFPHFVRVGLNLGLSNCAERLLSGKFHLTPFNAAFAALLALPLLEPFLTVELPLAMLYAKAHGVECASKVSTYPSLLLLSVPLLLMRGT